MPATGEETLIHNVKLTLRARGLTRAGGHTWTRELVSMLGFLNPMKN